MDIPISIPHSITTRKILPYLLLHVLRPNGKSKMLVGIHKIQVFLSSIYNSDVIAACGMSDTNSIGIWDIRRPFGFLMMIVIIVLSLIKSFIRHSVWKRFVGWLILVQVHQRSIYQYFKILLHILQLIFSLLVHYLSFHLRYADQLCQLVDGMMLLVSWMDIWLTKNMSLKQSRRMRFSHVHIKVDFRDIYYD